MAVSFAADYRGKTCVVTGAASGMGEATARLLAEAGAKVFGIDLKPVTASGVTGIACDMRDPASIDGALQKIPAPFDAVFSAAGLPQTFPHVDVMLVNFFGTRHLIEAALPRMRKGGAIACIASAAGMGWMQNFARTQEVLALKTMADGRKWAEAHPELAGDNCYYCSKEALVGYVTLNAPRFIAEGVRLNVLSPGMTDTPMLPEFVKANPEAMKNVPVPIGRPSTPEEQAIGLLMLNHPAATYLVGANLANDGGMVPHVLAASLGAGSA